MGFLERLGFKAKSKALPKNSGYGNYGASYARKSLSAWVTAGRSADEDIVDNIETLRERSRDLFMGSPLATGALKTLRTNVVGSGLALNPQIDAEFLGLSDDEARAWESNVQREWRLWAETTECDIERRQTFYQIQSLVLLSALQNGDVFVTLPVVRRPNCPYDLRISLIEADRICNPDYIPTGKNILGGVEVGTYSEPVAYWVAKNHPGAYPRSIDTSSQSWKRVPAFGAQSGRRNILHVMTDLERPAQRRGVPVLAPVIESLKQMSRYADAELTAAVVTAMFTVFVRSQSPQTPLGSMFDPAMDKDPNAYELGNGAIVGLAEGEDISIADPKRPNSGFSAFIEAMGRQVGAALEIPYEVLIKNFTSSYSASRGSLLEAWKMFRMRRDWLASTFCQPIYEEWLREAVLKGRVSAPGYLDDPAIRAAWSNAGWFGDSQGQLDPLKEAQAAQLRVYEGFSTREREAAELTGMKFEEIVATRRREEQVLKDSGLVEEPAEQTQDEQTQDENQTEGDPDE